MEKYLLIAAAGAAGTLCRYWLAGAVYALAGHDFPYGTFAVNFIGCLLFGVVFVAAGERGLVRPEWRIILLVGFMGAFTTFSTLIFETAELAGSAEWLKAGLNLVGQNVLGFAAFFLGRVLGALI